MTIQEFQHLKNFSIDEKDIFGRVITAKIENIQKPLMMKIDKTVTFAKIEYGDWAKFIVHDINQGKHSKNSFHKVGMAIDGHFYGLSLFDQVMLGLKEGFHGIGSYPDWEHSGIHFDIRPQCWISMWYQGKNSEGKKIYIYDWKKILTTLRGC